MLVRRISFFVILFAVPAVSSADLIGNYFKGHSVSGGIIQTSSLSLAFSRIDPKIDYWNGGSLFRWEPVAGFPDNYTVEWTGYLDITTPGDYGFGTMSDDGSQVWIDNSLVVDNRELQWYDWEDNMGEGDTPGQTPAPIYLGAGFHSITVRFYEAEYYDGIELWWLPPGSGPSDIPYYGANFHSTPPTYNPNTNWHIVPASVLQTTPEPGTLLLAASGFTTLLLRRKR